MIKFNYQSEYSHALVANIASVTSYCDENNTSKLCKVPGAHPATNPQINVIIT